MKILGLTGDIAAGKSTVAHMLENKGAALLDADALVRELYADKAFAAQVSQLFEAHFWDSQASTVRSLLDPQGGVDRNALGTLVFRDAAALRKLEVLVHPEVAALRERKIAALRSRATPLVAIVLEAVKLLESGQHQGCDAVWWIRATPGVQLWRLMQNRSMGEAAARSRLANQPDPEAKRALAGDIPLVEILNDGSLQELEDQVVSEWARFLT